MTDIVERLTDAEKLFIKAGVDGENGAKLVADARDEIERLRAALENVTIAYGMGWDMDGVIEVARSTLPQGPK